MPEGKSNAKEAVEGYKATRNMRSSIAKTSNAALHDNDCLNLHFSLSLPIAPCHSFALLFMPPQFRCV